jgi:hypothetical protein
VSGVDTAQFPDLGSRQFVELLALAASTQGSTFKTYQGDVPPGFAQPQEVAHKVIASVHPGEPLTPEAIRALLLGRQLQAQTLDSGVSTGNLTTEIVLPVGALAQLSGVLLRAQLDRLAELSGFGATIRLLPKDIGLHPGIETGSFRLLTVPKHNAVLFAVGTDLNGDRRYVTIDTPVVVARYQQVFDLLVGKASAPVRTVEGYINHF